MRMPRFSTPIRAVPCIACCSLLFVFVSVSLFQAFMSARYVAQKSTCMTNMKVVSTSILQYAQDWDETFPPAQHWADSAAKHILPANVPHVFHCPSASSPYSYVYNLALDHLREDRLENPSEIPMLYEGDSRQFNTFGDGKTPPQLERHYGFSNIAFADGHVRGENRSALDKLTWKIETVPAPKQTKGSGR